VSDVQTGLTALQKAAPAVITTSDVTLTVDAVRLLADTLESAYRGAKLAEIM
jgi:hypothetical protein